MLKKVCSLLLAIAMIAGKCSTLTVYAAENEKSGHIPNVSTLTLKAEWETLKLESFSINTLDDFKTLYEGMLTGKFNNRNVKLNTDLNLSGFDIKDSNSKNLYFNGKGHTIRNLYANKNATGLFGNLENSIIKNLNIKNRTVEASGYLGTDKDIVIPEKIHGLDVVGLGEKFYISNMDPADVNSITIPSAIKSIPNNCFDSFSNLSKVILGESIEEIGEHAFGYYKTGSGYAPIEGFTIYGYAGTAAETYANANSFNFVDLSVSAQAA